MLGTSIRIIQTSYKQLKFKDKVTYVHVTTQQSWHIILMHFHNIEKHGTLETVGDLNLQSKLYITISYLYSLSVTFCVFIIIFNQVFCTYVHGHAHSHPLTSVGMHAHLKWPCFLINLKILQLMFLYTFYGRYIPLCRPLFLLDPPINCTENSDHHIKWLWTVYLENRNVSKHSSMDQ